MAGADLTPTAVLCERNRGREKEAMESEREERFPPPCRDCRGESRLAPVPGHSSARTGQSCGVML